MSIQVLISGASVAGPALAHWLRRFGFAVTVVERAAGLRPGGQAVDIRGVGKEVVRRMGLDAAVRAARTETRGASYVTRTGRRIASETVDQFDGDGMVAEIEILRGDLAEVFHTATRDDVEYLFDDRITELTEDAGAVTVGFASGARRRFDLVIGADGLHSGVRALAFGRRPGTVHHLGHYLSFFTVPNHLGLDSWVLEYNEPGRVAGFRSIHGNRDAMAFLGFRSPALEYDHRDVGAQKALVRERMAGMGWEVPRLLERLDDAGDFYFDSAAQVRLERWSTGRVALLGDAAYCPSPLSGQGTSLAVVGAYLLAGELATRPGDHAAAFAAYERRMRGFVASNQAAGVRSAAAVCPPTRRGVWSMLARVALARYLSSPSMDEYVKAVNGIDLPDYELPAARA